MTKTNQRVSLWGTGIAFLFTTLLFYVGLFYVGLQNSP